MEQNDNINNSILCAERNTDERPVQQGAKTWQVALLMLMSAALAAAAVLIVLSLGTKKYILVDRQRDTDATLISELLTDIKKYYYFSDEAPPPDKLLADAAHAVVNGVGDPYAAYYTEAEFNSFRDNLNGNYKGIGVLVSAEAGKGLYVNRAYENNPAYKAGVRDGDYIIEVDGKSVIDMDVTEASALIAGEDGTTVNLKIVRGDETLELAVQRGDVYVKRVYTEILEDGIGYLRIDSFTGDADKEFDAALDELLKSGIKALVIDVRDNPGGELTKVINIADRILPECTITTLEGKLVDPPKVYSSTDEKKLDIPYVVLTNGDSASASEIFASAVQDNSAAKILGTKTFGKGIVQTTWEFSEGNFLKLTTDVYLTPNGRMIHGIGVEPDIVVEQNEEIAGVDIFFVRRDMPEKDIQVIRAVELIKESIG